jgi:hypothetical protein
LSRNSGASTSRNPKGLSRPVAGKLYLFDKEVARRIFDTTRQEVTGSSIYLYIEELLNFCSCPDT